MSRRMYMRTRQLKPGMRMDHAVFDETGRALVEKGATLDEYVIDSLLKRGVMTVYIREGEDAPADRNKTNGQQTEQNQFRDLTSVRPAPKEPDPVASPQAQQHIEELRTPDRAKMQLTASVKKRVAKGISYIYNNTNSEDFAGATDSIANDLMSAIEHNDAVAIDINALKTSDEYTFKHSVDVATIAMILAKQQGMTRQEIYEIGVVGLLHDVGKTQVPPEILNKPGRLTDKEFDVMKQHSVFGYRMIKERGEFNDAVLMGILQHHEKINGHGYPMGVNESQMTRYAKIISVADIYDALVTERSYKKAFTQRDAVEMIMSMTSELDMTAMKSFLESVILYPVDTVVELSNGERARVVQNSPHYILRPTVVGLTSGRIYNLGEDLSCANIIIR